MNTSKAQKEIYKQVKERSGGMCEFMWQYMWRYIRTDSGWLKDMRCGKTPTQIHHVGGKGMGGDKRVFKLDELIDLCEDCHRRIHG